MVHNVTESPPALEISVVITGSPGQPAKQRGAANNADTAAGVFGFAALRAERAAESDDALDADGVAHRFEELLGQG